jgi:ribonuclease E
MDAIIDFFTDLTENNLYILIIVGAIILFAIIGFIADRKKKKKIEKSMEDATAGPVEVEEPVAPEQPAKVEEPVQHEEPAKVEEPVATPQPAPISEPVEEVKEEPVLNQSVSQTEQYSPFGNTPKVESDMREESPLSGLTNNFSFNQGVQPVPQPEPTQPAPTPQPEATTQAPVVEEPIEEEKSWE